MSLNYYVETAFCVIEENQHVICSSGLLSKFWLVEFWIHCVLVGIRNSLVSLTKREEHHCKVANIYFSNLSKRLVIHSVSTKLKLSKVVNPQNDECWNLFFE